MVELMIVMLIIGVLMAIAVPNYLSSLKGAKEAVLNKIMRRARQSTLIQWTRKSAAVPGQRTV